MPLREEAALPSCAPEPRAPIQLPQRNRTRPQDSSCNPYGAWHRVRGQASRVPDRSLISPGGRPALLQTDQARASTDDMSDSSRLHPMVRYAQRRTTGERMELDRQRLMAEMLRRRTSPAEPPQAPPAGDTAYLALLATRMASHAKDHWSEFAAIVAAIGVATSVVNFGLLAVVATHSSALSSGTLVAFLLVTLASLLGIALAYTTIQVGTVPLLGPMDSIDVVTAFAVAAGQFGLVAWLDISSGPLGKEATPRPNFFHFCAIGSLL